jgi:pilus assembly protein CpaE
MDRYAILLAAVPTDVEAELAVLLGHPQAMRVFPDARSARVSLQKGAPLVAVVAMREPPNGAHEAVELVRDLSSHGASVVVLGAKKEPDLILAAMRAGAREYLVPGEDRRIAAAVQEMLEASGALRLASITAVLPAKGGMGATVLATHLAGALQRKGSRACVADLDLELGDVLTYLDLPGTYTLSDVVANARRLDRDLLDASVPRHKSGVWVLSQSERVADADRLGADGTTQVLRFLRHHYDHLVLDGLHDFGDVALAALDAADRILLVVTQEVPAVRDAQRTASLLRQLGYEPSRIVLVVNRYLKSSPITRQVIEETVRLPVRAVIGNDYAALSRAVNRGVLLWDEAPRSVAARDLEVLAEGMIAGHADSSGKEPFLKKLLWPKAVLHGAQ